MKNLNSIIIEGVISKDAESKKVASGATVTSFQVSTKGLYKKADGSIEEVISYFDVEMWGESLAEVMEKYGKEGRGVRLVGRIKQPQWVTEDGQKKTRTVIVGEHIEFKPLAKNNG